MDTSNVELSEDILELIELLAKNTHDNWAKERISNGWRYGPIRDDYNKEHPCLVPYEQLPEDEKDYDRITAKQTLKAIIALGYQVIKVVY